MTSFARKEKWSREEKWNWGIIERDGEGGHTVSGKKYRLASLGFASQFEWTKHRLIERLYISLGNYFCYQGGPVSLHERARECVRACNSKFCQNRPGGDFVLWLFCSVLLFM